MSSDERSVGAQDPLGSWYWQAKADSASKGADDALDAVAHQSDLRRLDIEYTEKRKGLLARHQAGREREQMRRAQELEAQQRRDMEGAQTLANIRTAVSVLSQTRATCPSWALLWLLRAPPPVLANGIAAKFQEEAGVGAMTCNGLRTSCLCFCRL